MAERHVGGSPDSGRPGRPAQSASWIQVALLCLWLAIEIGRPPNPLKIPLLCSLILGVAWILTPRKRWDPVLICLVGFLATSWIGVPFAKNQYSAFWVSYSLTIVIGCIALPAANFMKNMRQVNLYVVVFLASTAYVGLFATTHSGFGPAGAAGGQDENYVAATMSAALPFAYFGLSAARTLLVRMVLMGLTVVYLLATVIGFSRGGFLGMAAAGLFCFWYSPRKLVATGAAVIGIAAVVAVAPDRYWAEVKTIGDTSEGTADMRFELWAIATKQFVDHPILGVGAGNFIWRIEEYQTEEQIRKMGRSLAGSAVVHSTYFEILSELGGLGMGFFLGMLYFAFRELRRAEALCDKALKTAFKGRSRLASELEWARSHALAFQGGLIGYLACSAFLSTTYYSVIWLMCAASVALRYAVSNILSPRMPIAAMPSGGRASPTDDVAPKPTKAAPGPRPPRLSDLLGR